MGFRPRRTVSTRGFVACLPLPKLSASLEQGRPHRVDVSGSALRFLSARLRQHRRKPGTRRRRLSPGRQALPTLAHLRNGHPHAQLAAGSGIGTTTAYRYITEAVELLATLAPTLVKAARTASTKALVLLDDTLPPIDRITADRPCYSGEHKKHGMNVQILAGPPPAFGRGCPQADCCGPHRPCPEPSTTSAPPASTASSTPWPSLVRGRCHVVGCVAVCWRFGAWWARGPGLRSGRGGQVGSAGDPVPDREADGHLGVVVRGGHQVAAGPEVR